MLVVLPLMTTTGYGKSSEDSVLANGNRPLKSCLKKHDPKGKRALDSLTTCPYSTSSCHSHPYPCRAGPSSSAVSKTQKNVQFISEQDDMVATDVKTGKTVPRSNSADFKEKTAYKKLTPEERLEWNRRRLCLPLYVPATNFFGYSPVMDKVADLALREQTNFPVEDERVHRHLHKTEKMTRENHLAHLCVLALKEIFTPNDPVLRLVKLKEIQGCRQVQERWEEGDMEIALKAGLLG